jgi:hypothetical protein
LAEAATSLDMPLNDANTTCANAARAATLASGQAEIIERTHHAAVQKDAYDRELRQLRNLPINPKKRGLL